MAVEACDEDLLEVRAPGAAELARIAYHIGNRHVPIQIGDGWLRILPDHVLKAMVEGLGGRGAGGDAAGSSRRAAPTATATSITITTTKATAAASTRWTT